MEMRWKVKHISRGYPYGLRFSSIAIANSRSNHSPGPSEQPHLSFILCAVRISSPIAIELACLTDICDLVRESVLP